MGSQFDWRTLGTADYSQACALVASLPASVRDQLRNGEREILCRITHLWWRYAERSGRGTGSVMPSEKWLASTIARSDRTVRRYLTLLSKIGLLAWKRRMTKDGAGMTNLYSMGKTFLAMLIARNKRKSVIKTDRTKMSDNDLKREYKSGAIVSPPGLQMKLADILRVGSQSGVAAPPATYAWAGGKGQDQHDTRRELLKRQAALLVAAGK